MAGLERHIRYCTALAVFVLLSSGGYARFSSAQVTANPFRAGSRELDRAAFAIKTSHHGTFHGSPMAYSAIAGNLEVRDAAGDPEASIFSIAYTADTRTSQSRPVTFLYNGGPGSASFWIQMGAFGPVIVPYDSQQRKASAAKAGAQLVDNTDALLDVTDLVFIDPVGTAFSRALGKYKDGDFYKISTDADSVLQFIKTWLSVNHRWDSPRFIGGESYGSIRTAMMLGHETWLNFDGAILISQGLDWGTVLSPPGYDLGYSLFLPTFTATAWYHHKLEHPPATVEEAVQQAESYSQEHYINALAKGSFLSAEERRTTAHQLQELTGLPASLWIQQNLRIAPGYFLTQLLAGEGLYMGHFDTRFTEQFSSAYDPFRSVDPSLDPEAAAYLEGMRTYLDRYLEVPFAADYQPLTSMSGVNWTYDLENGAFVNPATRLGVAMRANPTMTLFVASGYFDASSPVYSAQYNIGHSGADMSRVTMAYYPTGHMMYVDPAYRKKLLDDVRAYLLHSLELSGRSKE